MNQAILNLIDKKMNDEYYQNPEPENWNGVLTGAFFENFIEYLKEKISSLPSDTQWIDKINTLQTYKLCEGHPDTLISKNDLLELFQK